MPGSTANVPVPANADGSFPVGARAKYHVLFEVPAVTDIDALKTAIAAMGFGNALLAVTSGLAGPIDKSVTPVAVPDGWLPWPSDDTKANVSPNGSMYVRAEADLTGFQTSVLSRPIFDPTSNTSGQIVVKKLWQVIGADLPPLVVGANGEPQPPGQGPLGQPGPSSPSGHPTVSAVNQLMRKFPDGWHPQLGGIYRLNMLVDGKITQADIMGSALKNNWNPIFVWSGTEAASTFRPLPADWPMTIVPTGASQTPVYMQALWIGEGEPFDSYKIDGDRDVFVLGVWQYGPDPKPLSGPPKGGGDSKKSSMMPVAIVLGVLGGAALSRKK